MSTGAELATAWVRLTYSSDGITDQVTKDMLPIVGVAGKQGTLAGNRLSMGLKAGVVAAAAGVVAGFAGLYKVGETMADLKNTIRAGTGASGEALQGLVDNAKNVAQNVPTSFEAASQTVADLNTRLGLSGETMETVAAQYLEAGRILKQDVDINTTSAAFRAFGIEGEQIVGGMDALFRASQATGVSMNELASGVQKSAPALKELGFSFEESIALMGTLDKAGLNSGQMASALTRSLTNLAKEGEAPAETFQRVVGEMDGFIESGDRAAAYNLAGEIFGTRGASQFVAAIDSGILSLDNLTAAAGVSEDTILGVGEETLKFGDRWQMVSNQAQVAIEPLATAIFDGLGSALADIMPHLQAFGSWLGENIWVIGAVAAVIGVTLVAAMIAWTSAIWAQTAALLASPITWIVLAIVALIAAIVLLAMNWEDVTAWISDVWNGFVGWLSDGFNALGRWWGDLWSGIASWAEDVWTGLVDWFSGALQWLVDLFLNWTLLGQIIKNWDAIKTAFVDAWRGIVSFFDNAIQSFVSGWQSAWTGIGNFVRETFENAVAFVKSPLNAIISLVNGVIGAINGLKIDIPDWVPGLGGQTLGFNIPNLPMLATGGTILRSGSVIVGEKGPELLTLPAGAVVDPDIDRGAGGGVTFINNAPLGQTVSQALAEFSDQARGAEW
ncbi:phage tail tape measure protein [Microcella alkaliphila]|uniref:Phage tail tape measure protein n=1 Tax=Microcella alkaliphila TaxID=279828 RepID=A0A0U5BLN7_9MICO|nr:phage tail tape measure protein [Microcella alkaliphila]BAU32453.1 phage tail tape measure protein [Microcella alkaliphila]